MSWERVPTTGRALPAGDDDHEVRFSRSDYSQFTSRCLHAGFYFIEAGWLWGRMRWFSVGCVKSSVIGIVVNGAATHLYAILCCVVFGKQQTGHSGKSVVHLRTLAAFEGKDADECGQLRPRVRCVMTSDADAQYPTGTSTPGARHVLSAVSQQHPACGSFLTECSGRQVGKWIYLLWEKNNLLTCQSIYLRSRVLPHALPCLLVHAVCGGSASSVRVWFFNSLDFPTCSKSAQSNLLDLVGWKEKLLMKEI